MSDAGKGDKRRPRLIPFDEYEKRWGMVFTQPNGAKAMKCKTWTTARKRRILFTPPEVKFVTTVGHLVEVDGEVSLLFYQELTFINSAEARILLSEALESLRTTKPQFDSVPKGTEGYLTLSDITNVPRHYDNPVQRMCDNHLLVKVKVKT